tara:strand:- start:344 stop:457 length:114 start_codon:yes stop_codon:yes gene_type:complete
MISTGSALNKKIHISLIKYISFPAKTQLMSALKKVLA